MILGFISALVFVWAKQEKESKHPRDYAEVMAGGIIRAATEYNSIGYYVDGDTVTGFHYELITAFARSKGLKVEIIPLMSVDKLLRGLSTGQFDVIASGMLATSELKDSLLLTDAITLSKQVLVQRKRTEGDSLYIKNQLDLAGKTLHLVQGSPSILRIHNLGREIGDTIYINEIEKYGSEQLISLVAHGDIDYAVCDASIAKAAIDSLPQLDINTAVSFTQFYAWAVSKQSPVLLDSLDSWLVTFQKSKEYKQIYQKYYGKQ